MNTCLHVHMFTIYVPGDQGDQKEVADLSISGKF